MLFFLSGLVWMLTAVSGGAQEGLVRFAMESGGFPGAVSVSGPLVWTGQVYPDSAAGGDVSGQVDSCVARLGALLASRGSSLSAVVRLHVAVRTTEVFEAVQRRLVQAFPQGDLPAVSAVVSGLPGAVLLGLDAVALCEPGEERGVLVRENLAVLPEGVRIFIAGQAESSGDLAEATEKTLQSLQATLEWLGRTNADIVQLKAFVQPMSAESAAIVRSVAAEFYGESVPPLVLVEWRSSATVPIEIELVAWGGPAPAGAQVAEYLTPPFMKSSPVYARVVRTASRSLVFTSGMGADPPADGGVGESEAASAEVTGAFSQLEDLMRVSGSDLRHLVKATYYVSGEAASLGLNQQRPRYYDPARPPAASKALVIGVSAGKRTLSMDMIAVPVPKVP